MGNHPSLTLLEQAEQTLGELSLAEKKLFTLAQEKFHELSESEYRLFRAVANGEPISYQTGNEADDKPENAANWGAERILRGDRLRWLCVEPEVWKLCLPQGIDIAGAKIEGALNLSFAEVEIPLRFFQCYFAEALRLRQAKLRQLDLSGTCIDSTEITIFSNLLPVPTSIDAQSIQVTGNIALDKGFEAKGMVSLAGASIKEGLECSGTFSNENGIALYAQGIQVTGGVFLRDGFEAKGMVNLVGASIKQGLECRGTFSNENGIALYAQGIQVTGPIFLHKGFEAKGRVSLFGASIKQGLVCSGTFSDENGIALYAESIQVTGGVFLRDGFEAKGEVNLASARIEGSLVCTKGTFSNENEDALHAESIQVTASVFLIQGFEAKGRVSLQNARIGNSLQIARVKKPEGMILDLQFAQVQTLDHYKDSFPNSGNLYLNGLVYEALGEDLLNYSDQHLQWLRLQPTDPFSSQPYEQLAKVLQSTGKGDEAVEVLIGREQDELKHGKFGWPSKAWEWFLGITIAYGYKPGRAIYWAAGAVLVGALLFHVGYQKGLITPTEKDCKAPNTQIINDCPNYPNYPKFNPIIYSLDVFLPIIDLRLKGTWLPNANQGSHEDIVFHLKSGAWLRYYFWLQVISGWVLTTLWAAGFTGLVRNTNR